MRLTQRALNFDGAGLLIWGMVLGTVFVCDRQLMGPREAFTEREVLLLFALSIAVVVVDHLYAIRNALVKPPTGDLQHDLEAARAYFARGKK